jgi:hypothetical protein
MELRKHLARSLSALAVAASLLSPAARVGDATPPSSASTPPSWITWRGLHLMVDVQGIPASRPRIQFALDENPARAHAVSVRVRAPSNPTVAPSRRVDMLPRTSHQQRHRPHRRPGIAIRAARPPARRVWVGVQGRVEVVGAGDTALTQRHTFPTRRLAIPVSWLRTAILYRRGPQAEPQACRFALTNDGSDNSRDFAVQNPGSRRGPRPLCGGQIGGSEVETFNIPALAAGATSDLQTTVRPMRWPTARNQVVVTKRECRVQRGRQHLHVHPLLVTAQATRSSTPVLGRFIDVTPPSDRPNWTWSWATLE